MIRPSSLAVLALKFLQKSMMFRPCGPSAVPTGGAGVAFPAAIWSFTIAVTFFAMILELAISCQLPAVSSDLLRWKPGAVSWKRQLQFLDLQEIQFDRRRPAEDGHHDLERVAIEVDLVHRAVEAGERAFVDPHL